MCSVLYHPFCERPEVHKPERLDDSMHLCIPAQYTWKALTLPQPKEGWRIEDVLKWFKACPPIKTKTQFQSKSFPQICCF